MTGNEQKMVYIGELNAHRFGAYISSATSQKSKSMKKLEKGVWILVVFSGVSGVSSLTFHQTALPYKSPLHIEASLCTQRKHISYHSYVRKTYSNYSDGASYEICDECQKNVPDDTCNI